MLTALDGHGGIDKTAFLPHIGMQVLMYRGMPWMLIHLYCGKSFYGNSL